MTQSFIYLRPVCYSPSVFRASIFGKTLFFSNEGHRGCLSLSQLSGGTSGVAILIAIAGLTSNRPCCYEVFVQTAAAPCCYFLTLYTFRTLTPQSFNTSNSFIKLYRFLGVFFPVRIEDICQSDRQ